MALFHYFQLRAAENNAGDNRTIEMIFKILE
jgi:hypothetical protein